jgi:glucose-1-phosphate adenylyltransferase
VFNLNVLDRALWTDRHQHESAHDFGRNILPRLVAEGSRVFAYPYSGYWVDVGTIESYWQAQMDLLVPDPPINLNDRRWVIHTRTEERPPVWIENESKVANSMLSDGCVIEKGAIIENSVLSPGVVVQTGAVVRESILMTDCRIYAGARVERAILDKRVQVGENSTVGGVVSEDRQVELIDPGLVLIGKNSKLPPGIVVHPGALIGTDVVFSDFDSQVVESGSFVQTKRQPFEISD